MQDEQDSDEDEDRVAALFDKARRAGAVQGTSADLEGAKPSTAFQGKARTLTGADAETRGQVGKAFVLAASHRQTLRIWLSGPLALFCKLSMRSMWGRMHLGSQPAWRHKKLSLLHLLAASAR